MNVLATPVNINTADAKTIADSLAGVGNKKAEAIVKDRVEKGPFKTVDDLKRVMGIGDKIIAANKGDILLTTVPSATKIAVPAPAVAPARK